MGYVIGGMYVSITDDDRLSITTGSRFTKEYVMYSGKPVKVDVMFAMLEVFENVEEAVIAKYALEVING